jgi:hypothetical protein
MKHITALLCSSIVLALVTPSVAIAQDRLEEGFANPPVEARPGTWFHVMSGNMTKEGITLDLEAMARVGIGHVTMFHVTQGIPIGNVRFASDEHIALVAHAAAEAKRLGIRFGLHNSDGWTSSGGPWVKPEQAMKRVVWSETVSNGGKISVKLPQPPTLHGFYRDIATIAFPAQPSDVLDPAIEIGASATGDRFDSALVIDGLYNKAANVELKESEAALTLDLKKPTDVAHADMLLEDGRDYLFQVSGSDDGLTWRPLAQMTNSRSGKAEATITANWTKSTVRYLRISAPGGFTVKEVKLSASQRIADFYAIASQTLIDTALPAIDPTKIIDLSAKVKADGNLATRLPKGDWIIMRTGYTATGAVNVPASPEGTGLEIDKFSKAAVEQHYNAYMRKVVDAARAIRPDAFHSTLIDSYEVGGQNWTEGYAGLFKAATGKDITPYLPLYAGRVVGNAGDSKAIYDAIRRLNSNLMVQNYFGHFAELARKDRLMVQIEGYGFGPFSDLDAGGLADQPMGEFWLGRTTENLSDMVSAARIYGRPIVTAEAFTAQPVINWNFHPAMAKSRGDDAWAKGINHFTFHRFAHQANVHVKPGMTMGRWGAHFDRHQPWWDSAGKAWFDYLARGQFLLQQGYAVADIAYFVGDETPITCPGFDNRDWLPKGYTADCMNSDVLLNRTRLDQGKLVLPEGNGYGAVVLGSNTKLRANTIARLEEVAAAGVLIFGDKPEPMPEAGFIDSDQTLLQTQIDRLWARAEVAPLASLPQRLGDKLSPDIVVNDGKEALPFTHRRIGSADIYFVANTAETPRSVALSLRVNRKMPEIWDAITGQRQQSDDFKFDAGRTNVNLNLAAGKSAFLVMQERAPDGLLNAHRQPSNDNGTNAKSVALASPWAITLASATGGAIDLPAGPLVDLKDDPDARARSFAGIATYRNSFKIAASDLKSTKHAQLDLGKVAVSATIRVNGKAIATSWTPPHRIDILPALTAGKNSIEIDVPTLWNNQLIADAALPDTSGFIIADRHNNPTTKMVEWYSANQPPPPSPRKSFSTQPFFKADDPLASAGLIGPVTLMLTGAQK